MDQGSVPSVPVSDDYSDPLTCPSAFRAVARRRILAYLVDCLILAFGIGTIWWVGFVLSVMTFGLFAPLHLLIIALLPVSYHTLLIGGPRSATFGMRLVGLRVYSLDRTIPGGRPSYLQAVIQTVCFYGSIGMTGSIILVVALLNPRRRTVHDWLAGTVIVNDRSFNR